MKYLTRVDYLVEIERLQGLRDTAPQSRKDDYSSKIGMLGCITLFTQPEINWFLRDEVKSTGNFTYISKFVKKYPFVEFMQKKLKWDSDPYSDYPFGLFGDQLSCLIRALGGNCSHCKTASSNVCNYWGVQCGCKSNCQRCSVTHADANFIKHIVLPVIITTILSKPIND